MNSLQFSTQLAHLIRLHRKQSGLTQAQLGEFAGVGKTVIFDIEHGKATTKLSTLIAVLNVLNIKIEFKSPLITALEKKDAKS